MAAAPPKTPAVAKTEIGSGDQYGFGGITAATWANRTGWGMVPSILDSSGQLTSYGMRQMALMEATDDTVGAMTWCMESALTQTSWRHMPQVDGKDAPDDPKAIKAAELADQMIRDMSHSWDDHIEEALKMIIFGVAPCEINLKQRDGENSRYNDGLWAFEAFPLRDPRSISGWNYDDKGNPIAMNQMGISGNGSIPTWKLLHYRMHGALNRPMGRSMLTNAHRSWYLKNRIQDSEAIGIDRDLAGLPIFRMPQADIDACSAVDDAGAPTQEALAARKRLIAARHSVSKMRMHEEDGLVLPSDTFAEDNPDVKDRTLKYDLKILTSAGPRTIDTRGAIRDYDMAIARVVLMQFLQLGTKGGGSYSLSSDQSEVAFNSLTAIANKICGQYNEKALPIIWMMNALNRKYIPRLHSDPVGKEGLQQMGAFLNGIGRSVELWQNDARARIEILNLLGIQSDKDSQQKAADAPKTAPTFSAKPAAAGGGETQ